MLGYGIYQYTFMGRKYEYIKMAKNNNTVLHRQIYKQSKMVFGLF